MAARPVEVAGGLVGEQQRGRCGERPGERDPLLLAARDLLGTVALETVEVELLHERVDALSDDLPRELLAMTARCLIAEPERQRDVLGCGEGRKQVEELEDDADVVAAEGRTLLIGEGVDIDPLDRDRALIGWFQAAEHVQQRALAAAARAHDRDELACRDGERDAADRLPRRPADPVDLAKTGGDDDAAIEVARGRFDGAELSQGGGPFAVRS